MYSLTDVITMRSLISGLSSWLCRQMLRNLATIIALILTLLLFFYLLPRLPASEHLRATASSSSLSSSRHLATQKEQQAAKVLISGYYRSGSTLTGHLFAAFNETLHLYEVSMPARLHWYESEARIGDDVEILGKTPEDAPQPLHQAAVVAPLYHYFQCNAYDLPQYFFRNGLWMPDMATGRARRFLKCSKGIPMCTMDLAGQCQPDVVHRSRDYLANCHAVAYGNLHTANYAPLWNESTWLHVVKPSIINFRLCSERRKPQIAYCAKILREDCLAAKVRVLKEIRLDLRLVAPLLHLDPEIKVIHLVRDPRGVMASTFSITVVKTFCKRMLRNIRAFELTVQQFPGCCLQMRYEDLTTNAQVTAAKVYAHTGLDFHTYYGAWTVSLEQRAADDGNRGLGRRNMSAEAYDWKVKVPKYILEEITNIAECVAVIRKLGYEL